MYYCKRTLFSDFPINSILCVGQQITTKIKKIGRHSQHKQLNVTPQTFISPVVLLVNKNSLNKITIERIKNRIVQTIVKRRILKQTKREVKLVMKLVIFKKYETHSFSNKMKFWMF